MEQEPGSGSLEDRRRIGKGEKARMITDGLQEQGICLLECAKGSCRK